MRPANWWGGGHILEWGGKKRGKREGRMTGGRKLEVAHRGEDKPAWPEFSTCPRAAVALPLQHAALQCARVCVLCASNRVSCVDSHVYIWSWCCKCELCLCSMFTQDGWWGRVLPGKLLCVVKHNYQLQRRKHCTLNPFHSRIFSRLRREFLPLLYSCNLWPTHSSNRQPSFTPHTSTQIWHQTESL